MLTMAEDRDWVQFVNPGDLRVANKTCGPCHEARPSGDEVADEHVAALLGHGHLRGQDRQREAVDPRRSYGPDGKPQIINHIVSKDDEDASKDGGVYQHGEAGRAPTPAGSRRTAGRPSRCRSRTGR